VGRIRAIQSSQSFTLEAYSLVGRGSRSTILLDDHRISHEHASLRHGPEGWAVRDLASTNGTWFNGQKVEPGVDIKLRLGDELAFGNSGNSWLLEDAAPPEPMAVPLLGGAVALLEQGAILVPDVENPRASIFRGAGQSWTLEIGERVRPIKAGDVIEVLGAAWRFSCPDEWLAPAGSQHVRLVSDSTLHFDVSGDERDVGLTVECDGERVAMGRLNAFYLLLALARHRLEAAREGRVRDGFTAREYLMRVLTCGETQLNVWVHRIRAKFASKEFLDYASIIERQDGSGDLRIGAGGVSLAGASST
jgi:hypothetical protein